MLLKTTKKENLRRRLRARRGKWTAEPIESRRE